MNKVLVDTNILIYSKDKSSIYHEASLRLFSGEYQLFVTSKNLSEYYAVVTRGESPLLSPTEAIVDLLEFISICEVLYPNNASFQLLCEQAILHQTKGLKIHDYEIACIALVNGVSKIATFNKSDFSKITNLEIIPLH